MPLNSVNTNSGAMIALQNLNATNSELQVTQQRINTGKKIANAKDNGAIWATAKVQSSTASSLNAVKDSFSADNRPSTWPWPPATPSPTCWAR